MIKHGIVLPSYSYNAGRVQLANNAFESLSRTFNLSHRSLTTLLLIINPKGWCGFDTAKLQTPFTVEMIEDPPNVDGTEQTLAYGTQKLFDKGHDLVTWMGDDALFHPLWLDKLRELMYDKPDALSWSVYRSAYTAVHQTLEENGKYVRVSSVCGHGMTFTKKEWETWGVVWSAGKWDSPYGDTLDMHHIYVRPQSVGERWVTKSSYVEHTGVEGLHVKTYIPEHATDFQGQN